MYLLVLASPVLVAGGVDLSEGLSCRVLDAARIFVDQFMVPGDVAGV